MGQQVLYFADLSVMFRICNWSTNRMLVCKQTNKQNPKRKCLYAPFNHPSPKFC